MTKPTDSQKDDNLDQDRQVKTNGEQVQDQQQPELPSPQQVSFPVATLVQSVGNRHYELAIRTIYSISLLILTFPRGLTLLLSTQATTNPDQPGLAQLDVHRKFLPTYGKYLHWITFTFPQTGTKVKAQIMLETRLEAACHMVQGGACACFLSNPLRTLRRNKNNRRRVLKSSR